MSGCGTRTCYVAGCRCPACTAANRTYARELERHHARRLLWGYDDGRQLKPDLLVDATETREHLGWLRSRGVGTRTIAAQAGVSRTTIQMLLAGRERIEPGTADAILAVHLGQRPGRHLLDARPVWRQVRDLQRWGWPKVRIAEAIGQRRSLQLGRNRVTVSTARKVDELWRWARDTRHAQPVRAAR